MIPRRTAAGTIVSLNHGEGNWLISLFPNSGLAAVLFFNIGALLIALGVLALCVRVFLRPKRARALLAFVGLVMILLGTVGLWALIPWPVADAVSWAIEIVLPLVWVTATVFFITGYQLSVDREHSTANARAPFEDDLAPEITVPHEKPTAHPS